MKTYHVAGATEVRAVQEAIHLRWRLLISLPEFLQPLRIQSADGLRQIAVHCRVLQIEGFRLVVSKDPGHHWVLGQVLETTLGVRVQ